MTVGAWFPWTACPSLEGGWRDCGCAAGVNLSGRVVEERGFDEVHAWAVDVPARSIDLDWDQAAIAVIDEYLRGTECTSQLTSCTAPIAPRFPSRCMHNYMPFCVFWPPCSAWFGADLGCATTGPWRSTIQAEVAGLGAGGEATVRRRSGCPGRRQSCEAWSGGRTEYDMFLRPWLALSAYAFRDLEIARAAAADRTDQPSSRQPLGRVHRRVAAGRARTRPGVPRRGASTSGGQPRAVDRPVSVPAGPVVARPRGAGQGGRGPGGRVGAGPRRPWGSWTTTATGSGRPRRWRRSTTSLQPSARLNGRCACSPHRNGSTPTLASPASPSGPTASSVPRSPR